LRTKTPHSCADYFGGLIKGLGGGYLLSPFGGMGRKSLLTLGSAGGVYFFDGIEASGFFSSFLGACSPFTNRTTCLTKNTIPTIHSPIIPASEKLKPKAVRKNVVTTNKIPKTG
jgi:hypothetical protein